MAPEEAEAFVQSARAQSQLCWGVASGARRIRRLGIYGVLRFFPRHRPIGCGRSTECREHLLRALFRDCFMRDVWGGPLRKSQAAVAAACSSGSRAVPRLKGRMRGEENRASGKCASACGEERCGKSRRRAPLDSCSGAGGDGSVTWPKMIRAAGQGSFRCRSVAGGCLTRP